MFSEKFLKFIEVWQKDFAIEKSIDEKCCLDKDGNPLPWYTYPAIEYLKQFDYSDKNIFEYGHGMSSLFWAQRSKKVISTEDNPKWLDELSKKIYHPNLEVKLREEGMKYENAIFETDDIFDIIVIDGKRRAECAETAIKKLSSDGMIILDDSDRTNTSIEYQTAIATLKKADLLQIDFYGFCPMNNYPKTTSIFFRRNFNFKSIYDVQPICGWGSLWKMPRKKRKEFYKKQM